jgi:hypothetical protein
MADFMQTMKNWKRMCNAMGQEDEYTACDKCDLRDFGCPAIYEKECDSTDWKHVENVVAKWAAEHPEPIYPSWIDWLMANGVIPDSYSAKHSMESGVRAATFYVTSKAFTPIPADIAQKLGIEPKEG